MNFKGLQFQFLILVAAAMLVSVLITGSVAYMRSYERELESGQVTLNGLIHAIERSAAIGAYAQDKVLLQELVDGMAQHHLVARVEIRDPLGTVQVHKDNPGAKDATSLGAIRHRLISPFDKSESVGDIVVMTDSDHMQAVSRQEATTISLIFVLHSAVLAWLIYVVGDRIVSRPIVKLAHALRQMKPGTSEQLTVASAHRFDEIGSLVEGANALLRTNKEALSKERELRAEVERMETQYRQIFDASSAGIFVLSAKGLLINCNPTVLRILGLRTEDMPQLRSTDFLKQVFVNPEMVERLLEEAIRAGDTVAHDLEVQHHRDGVRWVHCLFSVQGESMRTEAVMYDITERKRAELAALRQAQHDSLTGLKNRAACEASIDHLIDEATRFDVPVSILYMDLDGFKHVNDTLGHKAGDQVLMQCASRLRLSMRRSSDVLGRLGGDEFVAVLYGVGPDDKVLVDIANEIVQSLCQPIILDDGQQAQLGASVGIACFPLHASHRKQLLAAADEAMYAVKHTGKNAFAMRA
jgi:diguanylate cyclase (GGDEF)-like protein/PAS domain S-box-containing protein